MKRLWLVLGIVVAIGLVATAYVVLRPKPIVPPAIKSQITSTLLLPKSPDIIVSSPSMKYNAELKLLTYTMTAYVTETVVSEQPTPESFTDIPQVYDKVVASMNEYSKFDSDGGTVHLTRPKDLGGKQAAVMNAKGTLLFAKPAHDLSNDQWRKLFNGLEVVK